MWLDFWIFFYPFLIFWRKKTLDEARKSNNIVTHSFRLEFLKKSNGNIYIRIWSWIKNLLLLTHFVPTYPAYSGVNLIKNTLVISLTPLTSRPLYNPAHITDKTATTPSVRLVPATSSLRLSSQPTTKVPLTCSPRAYPRWDNLPTFCFGLILFGQILRRLSTWRNH